jgi:hypothetical protein
MADNIMPYSYFRTLLPALAEELPRASIFYEEKSNLSLDQVYMLRRAGVELIQPGIEALSSGLLKAMKKGVLARQNIALLRYARSAGLWLNWNLLCDFPGDESEYYESTLALIPLLSHLNPPYAIRRLVVDRFSPYFNQPAAYGISNLRPHPTYAEVFPETARVKELAYQFHGDYLSEYRKSPSGGVTQALQEEVNDWRSRWDDLASAPPALDITPMGDGVYFLADLRNLPGTDSFGFLTREEAGAVLAGGPVEKQDLSSWAIERRLAVELDGWLVPLAVSDYETMKAFERGPSYQQTLREAARELPIINPTAWMSADEKAGLASSE